MPSACPLPREAQGHGGPAEGWGWERKWQEAEPTATVAPATPLSLMAPHTKPGPECQDGFKNDALPLFIAPFLDEKTEV